MKKGKKGKNSFKWLHGAKEIKSEPLKHGNLELKVKQKKGFRYLPAIAFESIYNNPEYDYLKHGLYVSESQLQLTEDNSEIISEILNIPLEGFVGMGISGLNWFQTKTILQNLDMKLLTPAEHICMINYGSVYDDIHNFKSEMGLHFNPEWLDGLLKNHKDFYTHTEMDEKTDAVGGVSFKVDVPFDPNSTHQCVYFNYEDMDVRTGMPNTWSAKGEYSFGLPRFLNSAATTYFVNDHFTLDYYTSPFHPDTFMDMELKIRPAIKVKEDDIIDNPLSKKDKGDFR